MPSSTRRDFLRLAGGLALALVVPASRAAEQVRLDRAEVVARKDAYVLVGGYDIQLSATLEEALQRGVTLSFVQIFEADRPRDYWFAEDIAVLRRSLKLSWNALLRHYQVNTAGAANQAFERLPEAIQALGSLEGWQVLERRQLTRKQLYRARLRMYLDTSQLPKPLQLNAFASERWELDSGWREWSFTP